MEIRGKVVFNAIEGGFWGVLGDDGKKYRPTALAPEFQEDGLHVVIEGTRSSAPSIYMWGIAVDVVTIVAPERAAPERAAPDEGHDPEAVPGDGAFADPEGAS